MKHFYYYNELSVHIVTNLYDKDLSTLLNDSKMKRVIMIDKRDRTESNRTGPDEVKLSVV